MASMLTTGRAGFEVAATFGDYRGGPWHDGADVWIVVARAAGGGRVVN